MKQALIIASVASMIDQFNMPNIRLLQKLGYHVEVACNFTIGNTCSQEKIAQLRKTLSEMKVDCFQIDFERSITKIAQNIKAYKELKAIAAQKKYDIIHCHSPIGGFIGRLVFKNYRKQGSKVIYTAHGFHFYKGASLKNWLFYYPVERLCAHWTDVLITINKEDYALAQKKFKAKQIVYVPGVGIDVTKFANTVVDKAKKRQDIGVPDDAFLLLSVGELSKRKNHETVIRALAQLDNSNIHYVIAGQGDLFDYLIKLAKDLKVYNQIHLLGFRTDAAELYKVTDLLVFPSYQEGLPVSVMEAMASGLPCIVSKIRGNVDLINCDGGALCSLDSCEDFSKAISEYENNLTIGKEKGEYNRMVAQKFDISNINIMMQNIYESISENGNDK